MAVHGAKTLDEAEETYRACLKIDSGDNKAKQELQHLKQLRKQRKGGV